MRSFRRQICHSLLALLWITFALSQKVHADQITITTNSSFQGGVTRSGTGSVEVITSSSTPAGSSSTATGTFTLPGPIVPGPAAPLEIGPKEYCALVCVVVPLPGPEPSILSQGGGSILSTLTLNFGALGTATITSTVIGNTSTITADFTLVNVSLFPGNPDSFQSGGLFIITGAGPGSATGVGAGSLLGVSFTATINHTFLGNPTASLDAPVQIQTSFNYTAVSGNQWVFNGTINTSAVPEPATLLLLGTGLAGFAIKIRKKLKTRKPINFRRSL